VFSPAITIQVADSPALIWVWLATLLLATLIGYFAGFVFANRTSERGIRRAAKKLSSLFALVIESLEKAHRIAGLLEKYPQVRLTAEQVETLETKRGSLLDSLGRIVGLHRELPAGNDDPKPMPREPVKLAWQRTSIDSTTGLLDRAAFDANLRLMLDAGTQLEFSCGLLIAKIDRMDVLKSRFGIQGTDVFIKCAAAIISRAVREQDLVCRLSADTFGVLLPSVDAEAGRKLSLAIRNSVRHHTFRLQDVGPEVLVTASFGQALCPPGDHADLALQRAGDALAQSVRRGRNQLHVSDGESLVHCAAG
jgi:diguanylate cyclase (GGDEF)-like protein